MSAALAAAGARQRHVGIDQQRYGHPYFGSGCWFVLSDLAVAMPALDWRTRAHLEHRVAGRFALVHFCRGRESCLRPGELPAGAQFRQDLAGFGVSDEVADSFSRFYLPAVRPMRLLRRDLSRGNAGRWSPGGNSTATMENTLDDGGHRSGGRRIFVFLFSNHPPSSRIPPVLAVAETGSCLEECQSGAVRPGIVLCHQRGSRNHRVLWVPAEVAIFLTAMVLRRNPNPLRYFARRHFKRELAGAPSLGLDTRWLPGGDDDIKRRAGVGGSAHPSE